MKRTCKQYTGAVPKLGLAVAIGAIVAAPVHATTYQGTVVTVRVNTSSSGGTRVSVLTNSSTACTGAPNWYVFEYSGTSGPGGAWLAQVLAAKTSGQPVVIYGTGTCDPNGVETVNTIDSTS